MGPRSLSRARVCANAFILLLLPFFTVESLGKSRIERPRILILYEVGTAYPDPNLVDQGIRAALDTSPFKLEVYREYMESILFPDPADQQRFQEFYIRKYQNRRPDVIITLGPTPLKFMVEMRDRGFPGTPVVFCYPNWQPGTLTLAPDFTGVENDLSPFETIQAALRLQPGTRHIIVVAGNAFVDTQIEAMVKEQLRPYEGHFDVSYLTGLTMRDLLERLKHLPKHTIVLLSGFSQDVPGRKFVPAREVAPAVAAAANAPVFTMVDSLLSHGEVGGKVTSLQEQGRIAGNMALRILNGERPQEIPKVKAATVYMFDWRALEHWHFKESSLPPGSVVLNRPPSFWKLYWRYVLSGILALLVQSVAIFALLWHRAWRRKAELELAVAFDAVQESETRFRLVANTAPVMIWMSGPDKLCTYFNQPWLEFTGRTFEQERGNGWVEGVHSEDRSGCLKTYVEAFNRREPFKMQYRLRRHDGEFRWIFDTSVPRFNSDGSFVGYIGSCIDVTDRKLAEEALSTLGRKLLEAHEEERTWLARELHDDINQRLALLSVEIDRKTQHVSAPSAVEMLDCIRQVKEGIGEVAKDIQGLSHRLHSSKLEYLGIVSAAKGFCRELSEQKNIEIDFMDEGIPQHVPKELSLCLFRVLQEALQNAVKHSGVRHFRVQLRGANGELKLIVSDSGVGFDQKEAMNHRGLGLISMRERIQLLHGEFSIRSEPGRGAAVIAQVPLEPQVLRAKAAV